MRLDLEFPETWPRKQVGELVVVRIADVELGSELVVIEVGPLVPGLSARGEELIVADAPADVEIERAPVERSTTTTGWPMTIHRAVLRHTDGIVCEARLVAYYELPGAAGAVRARSASVERLAERTAQLLDIFAGARAILETDAPASIADLWRMD